MAALDETLTCRDPVAALRDRDAPGSSSSTLTSTAAMPPPTAAEQPVTEVEAPERMTARHPLAETPPPTPDA